jgi:hypothetical protein
MQIKSIILYNFQGEQRRLDFELGCVNLLTGDSDTGKSAIIPIISYCLGNSEFEIPEGVIRENVAWYAVLYQVDDIKVLVAKPKPEHGNIERNAFYKDGKEIDIPDFNELIINRNNTVDELSTLLRKSLNLSNLTSTQIEDLQIGIDNTHFYLFQEKEILITKKTLFYNQNVKKISETLPYFLGSKTEKDLELQEKLAKNKAELTKINITLGQYQSSKDENENRIKDFFEQAKQLRLIPRDILTESTDIGDMVVMLKEICNLLPPTPPEQDDLEPQQEAKLTQLKEEYQKKINELAQYQSYSSSVEGYSTEIDDHKMRLQSIGLFEDKLLLKICPLCSSELNQSIPQISVMQQALNHLDKNLEIATKDKIDYSEQIELLQKDIDSLNEQIDEEKRELSEIVNAKKAKSSFEQRLHIEQINITRLTAKIETFLELTQVNPVDEKELERKKLLEDENKNLINQRSNLKDILGFQLDSLNKEITKLATEKLELSYQGDYQFKLDRLDIIVKEYDSKRLTPMKRMGGSLNTLGCHLVTLLALHKHFLTEKTPVPSFLVLDQPIQGYLTDKSEDYDSEKINKIIQLLIEIARSEGLQIIVTEHKQLSQDGLHRVEKHWTKDNALIPSSWL